MSAAEHLTISPIPGGERTGVLCETCLSEIRRTELSTGTITWCPRCGFGLR